MIEVAQMGQLMAERVDEARVLEGSAGRGVAQSDPDRSVREADAITTLDVRALGLEDAIAQAESGADPLRVPLQPGHQLHLRPAIQGCLPRRSFVIRCPTVNAALRGEG